MPTRTFGKQQALLTAVFAAPDGERLMVRPAHSAQVLVELLLHDRGLVFDHVLEVADVGYPGAELDSALHATYGLRKHRSRDRRGALLADLEADQALRDGDPTGDSGGQEYGAPVDGTDDLGADEDSGERLDERPGCSFDQVTVVHGSSLDGVEA